MKIVNIIMIVIAAGNITAAVIGIAAIFTGHVEIGRAMGGTLILGCLPNAVAIIQKLIEDANTRRKRTKSNNNRRKG